MTSTHIAMPYVSVSAMHATAKPRAALGPIASNTSSFAEASGCATPHARGRGASFGLATAESSPESVARQGASAAADRAPRAAESGPRRRHQPYTGFALALSVGAAPSLLPAGYQWCGPGVNLHAAATARARTAADSTACEPAATPVSSVPAGPPPPVPAVATPRSTACAAAVPSGSRRQHDTSMSSDTSEPSMRPKYEGRRVVPMRTSLVATVQFRFRTEEFRVPDQLEPVCVADAVVVVQGDRGDDAGTVLCVEAAEPHAVVPTSSVRRVASKAEVRQMHAASACAEKVLEQVRDLVKDEATRNRQFDGLTVVDVDVQMDHQKVFVHYTAPWRVQFGQFTARVWRLLPFKARVWMNQINFGDTELMPCAQHRSQHRSQRPDVLREASAPSPE